MSMWDGGISLILSGVLTTFLLVFLRPVVDADLIFSGMAVSRYVAIDFYIPLKHDINKKFGIMRKKVYEEGKTGNQSY